MGLAKKCYECRSFITQFNSLGKSYDYGVCSRIGDCEGGSYTVEKERTVCLFGNADIKLSSQEIKERDERRKSRAYSLSEDSRRINTVIQGLSEWKREFLRSL